MNNVKKNRKVDFEAYLRWLKYVAGDMSVYQDIGNATYAAFLAGWKAGKNHTLRKKRN